MKQLLPAAILLLALVFTQCSNTNTQPLNAEADENTDTLMLAKSSQPMEEDRFWAIVDASLMNTTSQEAQEQYLIQELEKLAPADMIGFRLRTDKLLYDSYNDKLWCASHILNGGTSDDRFEYFRNWLISRGKTAYYKARSNPDNLVTEIVKGKEYYEFEGFWYVALKAFEKKTGRDLYEYIDYENFTTREGNYPDFQSKWDANKPETMQRICPRLFATFWR